GYTQQVIDDSQPQVEMSRGIKTPAVPEKIKITGQETVYQARVLLEPVGEEWDGTFVPIDKLSYAPKAQSACPQINRIESTNAAAKFHSAVLSFGENDELKTATF